MNKKYKYRFKTKEELRSDADASGTSDWRRNAWICPDGGMDYLFGTNIKVPYQCLDKNGDMISSFIIPNTGNFRWDQWEIMKHMLVKEIDTPLYEPKKFVY